MKVKTLLLILLPLMATPALTLAPCLPAGPSDIHIHFTGATSGCTETAPICLNGELISFNVTNDVQACYPFTYSYLWDFGDATTATGAATSHSFPFGPHTVTVTASATAAPPVSVTANLTIPVIDPLQPVPALSITMLLVLAAVLGAVALTRLR